MDYEDLFKSLGKATFPDCDIFCTTNTTAYSIKLNICRLFNWIRVLLATNDLEVKKCHAALLSCLICLINEIFSIISNTYYDRGEVSNQI